MSWDPLRSDIKRQTWIKIQNHMYKYTARTQDVDAKTFVISMNALTVKLLNLVYKLQPFVQKTKILPIFPCFDTAPQRAQGYNPSKENLLNHYWQLFENKCE